MCVCSLSGHTQQQILAEVIAVGCKLDVQSSMDTCCYKTRLTCGLTCVFAPYSSGDRYIGPLPAHATDLPRAVAGAIVLLLVLELYHLVLALCQHRVMLCGMAAMLHST